MHTVQYVHVSENMRKCHLGGYLCCKDVIQMPDYLTLGTVNACFVAGCEWMEEIPYLSIDVSSCCETLPELTWVPTGCPYMMPSGE